ncbi:MAG: GtrA family protein [Pseudomonadota bacterium]
MVGQAIRFAAVGAVNTALGLLAIYGAMYLFGTDPLTANAIGYAIGMACSFTLNRSWTFASRQPVARALPRFLLVVAGAYLLNLAAVVGAISQARIDPYLAQALGVVVYTVAAFIGCRVFVFAHEASRHAGME